jgi:hypothetical protein
MTQDRPYIISDFQKRAAETIDRHEGRAQEKIAASPTDEALERFKQFTEGMDAPPPKKVKLYLSIEERKAVYDQILERLGDGTDYKIIAQSVVQFLVDYLKDKEEESKRDNVKQGPVFRRVDG